MKETLRRKLAVLNLTGELTPEMMTYFEKRKIVIIDPLQNQQTMDWTHILTKDLQNFQIIQDTYQTLKKDIKLISLSRVADLQQFIECNGKLIFDEVWLKTGIGEFVLDKFLQEFAGITLGDNYPIFNEIGSFQIVNPFNTGEYVDRLCSHAFQCDSDALSIKTNFDHLLMFLTGLKNKKKVGFPIEVTYGEFNEVFGVQFHFFSQNLTLEDVTSCISDSITKKAEEYLLKVAIESTDFFDFTFLYELKKTVITTLWTKDKRIKFENKGLMFNNLSASAPIAHYPTKGVSSFLTQKVDIQDMSHKVILSDNKDRSDEISKINGKLEVDEGTTKISGKKFSEALAEKISSSMDLEKIKQIVSGNFDEEILSQLVPGSKDEKKDEAQVVKGDTEDDVKIKIGSRSVLDEMVNVVKGKFEEEKSVFKVSGGNFDPDDFSFRLTAGLSDKIKGDDNLKSRILQQNLPTSIKKGLYNFASNLNKDISSLTDSDLDSFKNIEIPRLINNFTTIESSDSVGNPLDANFEAAGFFEMFKSNLQDVLKDEFHSDSIEGILSSINSESDSDKVKSALKDTLEKSFEDKFKLSEKEAITDQEQEVLVKALTTSLVEDESKIRTIVSNEKVELIEKENDTRTVISIEAEEINDNEEMSTTPLFAAEKSNSEKKLEKKLKYVEEENEGLRSKVKLLMSELKLSKDNKNQVEEIRKKAAEEAVSKPLDGNPDSDQKLREQFALQLLEQKTINEQDAIKLAGLLERESKLIADIKKEEMKSKKIQIEAGLKETYLIQRAEKLARQLSAKDVVLLKSKETLTRMTEKKDQEICSLQQKLDQLTKVLSSGQSQSQASIISELEKQNANNQRMLEVYRNKLSSLANNIQQQVNRGDDGKSKDEVRKLQNLNNQYKGMIELSKKEIARLQDKSEQDGVMIMTLKQEKMGLEQELNLRRPVESVRTQVPVTSSVSDLDLKRVQSQAQMLEMQLKEYQQKYKELEQKLQETQRALRQGPASDDTSKVKVTQLENSLKKLTQDLAESRNQMGEMKKETNKLRQDKTFLQNQLEKIKKDLEKNKPQPKRPGGKVA